MRVITNNKEKNLSEKYTKNHIHPENLKFWSKLQFFGLIYFLLTYTYFSKTDELISKPDSEAV